MDEKQLRDGMVSAQDTRDHSDRCPGPRDSTCQCEDPCPENKTEDHLIKLFTEMQSYLLKMERLFLTPMERTQNNDVTLCLL